MAIKEKALATLWQVLSQVEFIVFSIPRYMKVSMMVDCKPFLLLRLFPHAKFTQKAV